jgi:hypothetical protein
MGLRPIRSNSGPRIAGPRKLAIANGINCRGNRCIALMIELLGHETEREEHRVEEKRLAHHEHEP